MQFRKCTTLLLAVLILVSNVGLAFNAHFCDGKLASVSSVYAISEVSGIAAPSEKGCCGKSDADHKSCCKDKTVKLKSKSDNVIKSISFSISAPFIATPEIQPLLSPTQIAVKKQKLHYVGEINSPPLFKLYSQYIFYA